MIESRDKFNKHSFLATENYLKQYKNTLKLFVRKAIFIYCESGITYKNQINPWKVK